MKLADLRKLSIRKQLRIRFRIQNGMECVINEHGVAQVPAWRGIADFNLEDELAAAPEFLVEPAKAPDAKGRVMPRPVTREELAAQVTASPAGAAAEHDED